VGGEPLDGEEGGRNVCATMRVYLCMYARRYVRIHIHIYVCATHASAPPLLLGIGASKEAAAEEKAGEGPRRTRGSRLSAEDQARTQDTSSGASQPCMCTALHASQHRSPLMCGWVPQGLTCRPARGSCGSPAPAAWRRTWSSGVS
jgi:hypothetical protein